MSGKFINFQHHSYGLGSEEAANFETEIKNSEVKDPEENDYNILALLREEEDDEHYIPPKDGNAHSNFNFMLEEEDLLKNLDKEQNDLFGSILVHTKIEERNAGALK